MDTFRPHCCTTPLQSPSIYNLFIINFLLLRFLVRSIAYLMWPEHSLQHFSPTCALVGTPCLNPSLCCTSLSLTCHLPSFLATAFHLAAAFSSNLFHVFASTTCSEYHTWCSAITFLTPLAHHRNFTHTLLCLAFNAFQFSLLALPCRIPACISRCCAVLHTHLHIL